MNNRSLQMSPAGAMLALTLGVSLGAMHAWAHGEDICFDLEAGEMHNCIPLPPECQDVRRPPAPGCPVLLWLVH